MNNWQLIALVSFVIILPVAGALTMRVGPAWLGGVLYVATVIVHVAAWTTLGSAYKWRGEALALCVFAEVGVTWLLVWALCARIEYGKELYY